MLQVDGWKEWAEELAKETRYSYEEISRCVDALGYEIGESTTKEIVPKILRLMSGMGTELKPSSLIKGFFTLRKLATAAGGLTAAVVDEIRKRPDLSERYLEESKVCQPGTRHTGSKCVIENPDEGAVYGGSDIPELLEKERASKVEESQKELLKRMKSRVDEEGPPERTYTKTEILEEAAKQCIEQGTEPEVIRAALSRGRPGTPHTRADMAPPVYCDICGEPKENTTWHGGGQVCLNYKCSSNTISAPETEEPDIKLGEWVCRYCGGPILGPDTYGLYECRPCMHSGTLNAVGKRREE